MAGSKRQQFPILKARKAPPYLLRIRSVAAKLGWLATLALFPYLFGYALEFLLGLGILPQGRDEIRFIANLSYAIVALMVFPWLLLVFLPQLVAVLLWRPRLGGTLALSHFNPIFILISVLQLLGQIAPLLRYRFRLPSPKTYRQKVDDSLPFQGVWLAANGGPDPATSHSWEIVGQRYAYDFLIVDPEGKTFRQDEGRLEDYYAFGAPVLAPADGVVVAVQDRHRDAPRPRAIDLLAWSPLGNYVLIRHAEGEYSLLAHLRRGSVRVRPGEWVRRGQVIGECGNSGNSTEPHLHFQVQDHPNFYLAASLPVRFRDWCYEEDGEWRRVEEGYPLFGDRVRNCVDALSGPPVPDSASSQTATPSLQGEGKGGE